MFTCLKSSDDINTEQVSDYEIIGYTQIFRTTERCAALDG